METIDSEHTVGEALYELVRVLVMHPVVVGEQVEVAAHAVQRAAQRSRLEPEVLAPEVEELFHHLLGQLRL